MVEGSRSMVYGSRSVVENSRSVVDDSLRNSVRNSVVRLAMQGGGKLKITSA